MKKQKSEPLARRKMKSGPYTYTYPSPEGKIFRKSYRRGKSTRAARVALADWITYAKETKNTFMQNKTKIIFKTKIKHHGKQN